jgi:thiamine biosynthesis lipoprotein
MSPEASFRSMGVDVVVRGAGEGELAAIRSLFEEWDDTFSRFRPDSELNRINRSPAVVIAISPLFAHALGVALGAAETTDGLVDPTLGIAIEAAGYDRDFADLRDDAEPPGSTVPGRWRSLRLTGRLLGRHPGTRIDLNGVVKSLAVDEALFLIGGDGVVSAGGDLAARGSVVVGLPDGGSLRLLGGGVATSGTAQRHWGRGGALKHHLIDPVTGRPAESRWSHVTVAARSCLAADVAAKAAFLLSDDGPGWLDERGLPGRFLDGEEAVTNAVWDDAMDAAAA